MVGKCLKVQEGLAELLFHHLVAIAVVVFLKVHDFRKSPIVCKSMVKINIVLCHDLCVFRLKTRGAVPVNFPRKTGSAYRQN